MADTNDTTTAAALAEKAKTLADAYYAASSFRGDTLAVKAREQVREAIDQLATLAAAQARPAEAVSARELLQQVFSLCEETENLKPERAFDDGRRFEAKGIRRAIGTWFQDESKSSAALAPAAEGQGAVAWGMLDAAGNVVDCITEGDRQGDMTKWSEQYPEPLYRSAQPSVAEVGRVPQPATPKQMLAVQTYLKRRELELDDIELCTLLGLFGIGITAPTGEQHG